jgi:hypothetical protein
MHAFRRPFFFSKSDYRANAINSVADAWTLLLKRFDSTAGLPDFSWYNIPKVYQITNKLPNGPKIHQMAVIYEFQLYQHFPFQGPPIFTQIGIFCLKICHLEPCSPVRQLHLDTYLWYTFFKKEVAQGGERTRVLSISFIFSLSPLYICDIPTYVGHWRCLTTNRYFISNSIFLIAGICNYSCCRGWVRISLKATEKRLEYWAQPLEKWTCSRAEYVLCNRI